MERHRGQTFLHLIVSVYVRNPRETGNNFIPTPLAADRALLLECQVSDGSMVLCARFDPHVMDDPRIHRYLRQLGALIERFLDETVDLSLDELDAATQEDREEIQKWNMALPTSPIDCIQNVIAKWTATSPQRPAVSGWDGNLTYAELHDLSTRLALHIQSFDLRAESVIPVCFERSKWVIVSMLAILKAGAAFTLIDSAIPTNRIEAICRQVSPKVALVCESQAHKLQPLVSHCVTIDDDLFQSLPFAEHGSLPVSKLQDLAWVAFTSGSTGEPKGIMTEHRGISTFASEFGPLYNLTPDSRGLHFASYAYVVSILETFTLLFTGACVCIPSEHDRINNISGFIRSSQVTFAMLTPSFLGTIQPESVPSLDSLVTAGEPMTPEIRDTWAGRFHLFN
jgi:non-ribosomal peptide synthetase component F